MCVCGRGGVRDLISACLGACLLGIQTPGCEETQEPNGDENPWVKNHGVPGDSQHQLPDIWVDPSGLSTPTELSDCGHVSGPRQDQKKDLPGWQPSELCWRANYCFKPWSFEMIYWIAVDEWNSQRIKDFQVFIRKYFVCENWFEQWNRIESSKTKTNSSWNSVYEKSGILYKWQNRQNQKFVGAKVWVAIWEKIKLTLTPYTQHFPDDSYIQVGIWSCNIIWAGKYFHNAGLEEAFLSKIQELRNCIEQMDKFDYMIIKIFCSTIKWKKTIS